jgi:hypothetical protein
MSRLRTSQKAPDNLMIEPQLRDSLKDIHDSLLKNGKLLSPEKLEACYALFRQRFGPEVLSALEGEKLLKFMHGRPSKDSLVYWIEFKNDDELPAKFGSIAGGSALKFGLYWRQKTGAWMTGDPRNQKQITQEEAIGIATKQRDEFLAAAKLLSALSDHASDAEYLEIQRQIDEKAPAVSGYAWGHKYLSLLFPGKLDDYHNEDFQRFYLRSLFQEPPSASGLYACAGRFVAIASALGMPMNHLTTVLNHRIPKPRRYWRIGTKLAAENSIWELMKNGRFIAIGWAELEDLTARLKEKDFRERIKKALEEIFSYDARVASRKAGEIQDFALEISSGDIVLAADGSRILGIGRVTSPYNFDSTDKSGAPHHRAVEWITFENWQLPESQGLQTTVYEIGDPKNLIEIERRAAFPSPSPANTPEPAMSDQTAKSLPLNVILYGPPGTGKTYRLRNEYMEHFTERQAVLSADEQTSALVKDMAWWEVVALALLDQKDHKALVGQILEHPLVKARLKWAANKNPRAMLWASLQSHTKKECPTVNYATRIDPLLFSKDENSVWCIDDKLAETEAPELGQALQRFHTPAEEVPIVCRYRFTTFHQSFSYEDFVEGIKPQSDAGQISYEVRDGIFKVACQEAAANPKKRYAVFIDEINRGNVASIFGELITLIEDDKRMGAVNELRAELPYSRQTFGVPNNLHIIGTMNTADRSVEALDTALRRRFTFMEMRPDPSLIEQPQALGVDLRQLLKAINSRIEQLLDHEHCIGHAYFMTVNDLASLRTVFANKIIPLLREHFYGNPAKVGMVLGDRFVVRQQSRTPFAAGSWADDLDEKEVFTFADMNQLGEADFQAIYAEAHPSL